VKVKAGHDGSGAEVTEEVKVEIMGVGLEVIVLLLVLVGWFVLMRFVLPRLGVST
jgi:hypothetical protein